MSKIVSFGPLRIFGRTIRFRPRYKTMSRAVLEAEWNALGDDEAGAEMRKQAILTLETRLNHRGRSYNGLQVLMALVAAVEATVIVFTFDKLIDPDLHSRTMGYASVAATVALIALAVGVLPLRNEVIPEEKDDEGKNALDHVKNAQFGRFWELKRRSAHQRHVLWRSRVWFGLSVVAMLVSLIVVIVGIFNHMPTA